MRDFRLIHSGQKVNKFLNVSPMIRSWKNFRYTLLARKSQDLSDKKWESQMKYRYWSECEPNYLASKPKSAYFVT